MRKTTTLLTSMLLAAALGGTVFAADLPQKAPPPVFAAPAVYNWTGAYLGLNGGGAWGNSNWPDLPSGSFTTSGGLIGLTLGYNWQVAPWVFGLEGDIDWASINGGTNATALCAGTCSTKTDWLGTVRGRLGYAVDRVLPYVTGGFAFGDIKATQAGFAGVSITKAGWTAGGGVEFAIAPQFTAKIEYLYVDLGSVNCGTGVCDQLATSINHHFNVVRAGVNYRF